MCDKKIVRRAFHVRYIAPTEDSALSEFIEVKVRSEKMTQADLEHIDKLRVPATPAVKELKLERKLNDISLC